MKESESEREREREREWVSITNYFTTIDQRQKKPRRIQLEDRLNEKKKILFFFAYAYRNSAESIKIIDLVFVSLNCAQQQQQQQQQQN